MSEELNILKQVATKLNDAGIAYMLSGSMAMNYYAQPRMTRDIDIVIVLKDADADRFVSLFDKDFYIERETVVAEVRRRGMFNIIHNEYIMKVDFMLLKDGGFDDSEFARRKRVDIDGVGVWMISAEDLILYKLLWAKDSVSEMQLKDVKNVIESVKELDEGYLSSWAKKLDVAGLLDKAMA